MREFFGEISSRLVGRSEAKAEGCLPLWPGRGRVSVTQINPRYIHIWNISWMLVLECSLVLGAWNLKLQSLNCVFILIDSPPPCN